MQPIERHGRPARASIKEDGRDARAPLLTLLSCVLREPLLHFLVIGAVIFAVYSFLHRGESGRAENEIVVSAGQIEHLVATFTGTWQRPPTREELDGLVNQYVREEIFSREAIKLGLDENDPIIRRRLEQKMEFITDDLADAAEPTEDELARYLATHPETFREETTLTLRQVYLDPRKHGTQLNAAAAMILAELKASDPGADASEIGDPTMLPDRLDDEPAQSVVGTFGEEFAETIRNLPVGEWLGPVYSPFGAHIVRVEKRTEGRVPPLSEIRETVEREWANDRRREADAQLMANLRSEYRVTIEGLESQPETRTP